MLSLKFWRRLPFLGAALLIGPVIGADRPAQPLLKARVAEINKLLTAEIHQLEKLYIYLHSHPELSLQEERTAACMAKELKAVGFEVTEKVGRHGIVGVLRNGLGPTVLVRTDMDALPIEERTGLPYASKERHRDHEGHEVGVMHACGHDIHMACWVGTARALARLKDRWQGTLVFIGQPAEENGAGARLMLEAGLFRRFPRPDYGLALHCDARYPHGHVAYSEGQALANVDSLDIVVRGKGGHGAAPHLTVDPVVLAARLVLDLQTIVSRETEPTNPVVVTVGSIHGGTRHNIIPGEVKLQVTVRTTGDLVRQETLAAIERLARANAQGARAPEPLVRLRREEFTPALVNDVNLARRTVAVFREVLGPEFVHEEKPVMGGEDFSRYGREGIPIFLFWLGTVAPEGWAEARREGGPPFPPLHSDQYCPVPLPILKTGVLTMSMAVLNLVGK